MVPTIARRIVLALAIGTFGTVAFAAPKEPAAANAPKIPATAEDHLALARQYQEKAATYRKEAQEHRDMAAAARDSSINAHKAHGQKDASVAKMEKHCAALAAAADKLATENEKAAEFHTLRGKELQGK
jgi:Skp family chaperone for outer membrane proteins